MASDDWLADKSERTGELSTVHHPLGHEGLWHTPSKKVPVKQQLPAYIQNIARALMRQGHSESSAIAIANAAVNHWRQGQTVRGQWGHVHPEVRSASSSTHSEWEQLRAAHHKADSQGGTNFDEYGDSLSDPYSETVRHSRVPESGEDQASESRAYPQPGDSAYNRRKKKQRGNKAVANPWLISRAD